MVVLMKVMKVAVVSGVLLTYTDMWNSNMRVGVYGHTKGLMQDCYYVDWRFGVSHKLVPIEKNRPIWQNGVLGCPLYVDA